MVNANQKIFMESSICREVQTLYEQLLGAWNKKSACEMAELFTKDGEMIGYDGSQVIGRKEIFSHLEPIFEQHDPAPFVSKVITISLLSQHIILLRAIAGMVPPGETEVNPEVNAHQTLIAISEDGNWKIRLFQNTPAQFHGRPELVEQMTKELNELIK